MDHARLDVLTRAVAGAQTRRATVGRSLAVLGALGGALAAPSIEAKKKCKKKKCKKPKQPTCAVACHAACNFCYTRAAGPLLCGTPGGGVPACSTPCFSDNDCVGTNHPYCITRIESRETGESQPLCPETGGWCANVFACA